MQKLHPVECVGQRPAESIGVDMKESEIFKQTEFLRQVTSDVPTVDIDTGNNSDVPVV